MAGPERRQHLIDVALRLFATRGFKGTTTQSIAAAAGVSEGVIFRHFRSKEELYDAILDHKARSEGFDRIVGVLRRYSEQGDDERLVLTLALKVLDSYRNDSDFRRLLLYAALEGHDLAKAAHRTFGGPMFSFLREYVDRRQKAGMFRAGNPNAAAFALVALPVYFGIVNWLFRVEPLAYSNRKLAEEFARMTLDGLRTSASGRRAAAAGVGPRQRSGSRERAGRPASERLLPPRPKAGQDG